ncbi:hypothetical protein [Chryseobacterium culicis]|uniref:Uncharacterized protein n=1 Tax=Chryseobacterium culicis TaxID=680127 RepID=A0A1H6GZA4_CHRCI|nr:hypothetical protein [Chryseobacterium culicis]MBE4947659.1 hypothetical protein [Chryseobacterium culicis]SEH28701.1 hypothetical protein SAMN05421593_0788 [Chryseobacterium culicis]
MKNIKSTIAAVMLSVLGSYMSAQIKGNQTFGDNTIQASSAFLDASSTANVTAANLGKGFIFPRADITQLALANQGTLYNAGNNPNRFDGMIVYNTASTGTAASGTLSEPIFPGFWYYDNKTTNPTGGVWRPIANAGTRENILTTETVTNRQINSAQVYGIKGTFAASGTSTSVTIPAPTGMTAMYAITIYKAGSNTVYSRELYSYDPATGAAVTGSPSMSVVYPNGTYDYVLEYLK